MAARVLQALLLACLAGLAFSIVMDCKKHGIRVSSQRGCDGDATCDGGIDEDPEFCEKATQPMPLAVNESVTIAADILKNARFMYLAMCDDTSCNAVSVWVSGLFSAALYRGCSKYGVCEFKHRETGEIQSAVDRNLPNNFVMEHVAPGLVKFWQVGNHKNGLTQHISEKSHTLRIVPLGIEDNAWLSAARKYKGLVGDLAVDQGALVTVQYRQQHSGVVFDLCDEDQCHSLGVKGLAESRLAVEAETLDMKDAFCVDCRPYVVSNAVKALPPGELKFVVRHHREAGAHKLSVWLYGQRQGKATITTNGKASTLRVRPRVRTEAMPMQFSDVAELLTELNSTIFSKEEVDLLPRARLEETANTAILTARNDDESAVARWMALAVNTLPYPSNSTSFPLVTNVEHFVKDALLQARDVRDIRERELKSRVSKRGMEFSYELGKKINATTDLLENKIKPSIDELDKILKEEADQVAMDLKNATATIEADEKKIKEIEKKKIATGFLRIVGSIFSFFGGMLSKSPEPASKAGGYVLNGAGYLAEKAADWIDGGLNMKIDKLKEEIQSKAHLLEAFTPLLPLLDASRDLVRDLDNSKDSSIDVRAWLASPAVARFKAKLVLLSPQNVGTTLAGMNLFDLFTDAGHNLVDAMDKVEWYVTMQVLVDLSTPDVPTSVSESYPKKYRVLLDNMRSLVAENGVVSDYRTTMRSLQLYAFPFCSNLGTNSAEQCIVRKDLGSMVDCVTGRFSTIIGAISKQKDNIYTQRQIRGEFIISEDRDTAFARWKQSEYGSKIADVLAGKEVQIHSDVLSQGFDNINAVKFNTVGLQFWHDNSSVRDELAKELEKFTMSLTHMGNSHFLWKSNVVAFSHRVINIGYSFKEGRDGEPVEYYNEYEQLKKGDRVLSPYALWNVKLQTLRGTRGTFTTLKKYASMVDMALAGTGSFVDTDVSEREAESCTWDYKVFDGYQSAHSPFSTFTPQPARPLQVVTSKRSFPRNH